MSGVLADYGQSLVKATTLAKEDAGPTALDYQFIFEDSHDDQTRFSILGAQKLANVDKVTALISMWDAWYSVSPTTSKNDILHLGLSWDRQRKQTDLDFLCYPTTYSIAKTFLNHAKANGYQRVAFLATKGGGAILMQKDVEALAKELGIEVVLSEQVNPGTRDFRTLLAKTENAKAQLIMCVMWPPMLDSFLKQYLEFKTDVDLAGVETWRDSTLTERFEGSWEVTADDPNGLFESRFSEKFGEGPAPIAAYAYDAASLLIEASEAIYAQTGKAPTGPQIADWIKAKKDFTFPNGKATLNEFNQINLQPNVVQIYNGQRTLAE